MKTQLSFIKSTVAVLLILTVASACKKNEHGQTGDFGPTVGRAVTDSLVFSEEFNGGTLDPTKWTIAEGNENVNNEMQTYAASAVKPGDSALQLEASAQPLNGRAFTSGKISSKAKFQFKYGRIEARLKFPDVAALSSSFQLTGVDAGVPQNAELDIVQHINTGNRVQGGIRWDSGGGANFIGSITTTPGDFHVYAVEWNEFEIKWFVDNQVYHIAKIENAVNSTEEFHKPFFIDLKLVVGGDLSGPVPVGTLPGSLIVDYIKVYKRANHQPAPPVGRDIRFFSPGRGFISAGPLAGFGLTVKPLAQDSLAVFKVLDAGNGKIALKSFYNNVSSENGDIPLSVNKPSIDAWEKFDWVENSNGTISLRGNNLKYVTVTPEGNVICTADTPTGAAQFL